MNTPTISAVPPVVSGNSGRTQTGSGSEPESTTPFAAILTRQRGAEPTGPAQPATQNGQGAAVEGRDSLGKKEHAAKKDATTKDTAAKATEDAALAQAAGEQGLTLPQIALTIAAEAAAVQQSSSSPAAAKAQAIDAATQGNPAATGHPAFANDPKTMPGPALAADLAVADAPVIAQSTSSTRAPIQSPAASIIRADRSAAPEAPHQALLSAIPANAVQAPAAPAHQTLLNANKAASLAGARQAVLTMQARVQAAGDGQARFPLPEVSAAMASAARVGAPDTAMPAGATELAAAQIGAVASSHSATSAAGLPSNGLNPLAGHSLHAAQPAVGAPLQSPQWPSEFGRQFVSIAQGGHNMPHTAELRLDPPELGPLRITINISDNVAHAVFVSPHAGVRQAVENAMSQLQQSLAQAGISLGQTSVSDQGQSQQAFNESFGNSRREPSGGVVGAPGLDGAATQTATRSRAPEALVDTFA